MAPTTADPSPSPPESTDLERRVLAHERILQSLLAYMARTEPRFVDHLRQRFVEPMAMTRHEHAYRDVDDYAEEFIRAVMHLGVPPAPQRSEGQAISNSTITSARALGRKRASARSSSPDTRPDRVQLKERDGMWEVTVDGKFRGDYPLKEHALAAVALAHLSLR
ncbi:hypothetical protein [Aquibaculum sediminis]|uniref:hypothetical protein n=1 Tax=Aquibaculum sediminis TaxID=3231907 RepID=UPI003452F610